MLRSTIRYMVVPAIAMLVTLIIFQKLGFIKSNEEVKKESISDSFEKEDISKKQDEVVKDKNKVTTSKTEFKIGGNFTLTNQDGKRVSSTIYSDKIKLIYFGFTNCPDICPTDLSNISQALSLLSEEELNKIKPIFITIDPERDTVDAMKTYLSSFHPSIEGFTGTNDEIVRVIKDFRVFSQKVEKENLSDYLMNHSSYTYLVGKDGYYISHFNHNEDPKKISDGIREKI